jgi:hypothetical protein
MEHINTKIFFSYFSRDEQKQESAKGGTQQESKKVRKPQQKN